MFARDVCLIDQHGWLGSISQQYHTSVPRLSQRDCGTRTSVFASVTTVVYCYSDQADREETCGRGDAQVDSGDLGTGDGSFVRITRWNGPQYRLYRTLEWNGARTVGGFSPQMSSCGPTSGWTVPRGVCDWMHLQLVLASSRVKQSEPSGLRLYPSDG